MSLFLVAVFEVRFGGQIVVGQIGCVKIRAGLFQKALVAIHDILLDTVFAKEPLSIVGISRKNRRQRCARVCQSGARKRNI